MDEALDVIELYECCPFEVLRNTRQISRTLQYHSIAGQVAKENTHEASLPSTELSRGRLVFYFCKVGKKIVSDNRSGLIKLKL